MKKVLVVFLALALVGAAAVSAGDKSDSIAGAAVTEGSSTSLTETTAETDAAEGGNVTEINLSTTASTTKWQGYIGSLSATLKLGGAGDVLYNFGAIGVDQIKSVFATTDSSFDFSNLQVATAANVDTAWSFTATDEDSAASTFSSTRTISQVTSVPTIALNSFNSSGSKEQVTSVYTPGLFDDGSNSIFNDFAFGVSVSENGVAYDNVTTVDYELIVPVNTGGVEGTQTYTFFLDIE